MKLCLWLSALLVVLFAGCQKPGPVELRPPSESAEVTGVEPVAAAVFEDEPDTTGLLGLERSRFFGELVLAGVRYDSPNDSHVVDIARAVFYDSTRPVRIGNRTIGYRTIDIGSAYIDGLPLYRLPRRKRIGPPGFSVDTLLGVQYALVSKDGIGGRGFAFLPAHGYHWTNLGSPTVAVDVREQSARAVRVLSPTALVPINVRRNLVIEWAGGEDIIYLVISTPVTGGGTLPLLRMRLQSSSRRVVLPGKVLQMLPLDRASRYLFSFISSRNIQSQVSGFPGPVLVHSASIHNVLVTVQR